MNASFIPQLARIGALAPSADNSQPWTLRWDGRELSLNYADRHGAGGVFNADSHATLMAVGAVLENLDMALAANGLAADWRMGNGGGQPYAALGLPRLPPRFSAPDGPLLRHTNRLGFRATPLPADLISQLGLGDDRALKLLVERGQRKRLVRLVRLCSEARFCNRALHDWLFDSLRHTPQQVARGDGLDVDSLGLPPGGRQMLRFISHWPRLAVLNRFGAYKLLALSEVKLIAAAPGLLCVTGGADRNSIIDAGRRMTRVWTALNLQGIAAQPYYVVTDQLNRRRNGTLAAGFDGAMTAVEQEVAALLGLAEGSMLHMILRVGYPADAPLRSRRLPLEAVFHDASAA
ncbi:hypothetical protein ACFOLJ_23180 [Rugamonas sp. CCM 8940]|uniref:hypothetical protein n=1 Tax=Rugamonas sp. CCM 8940 TaxID=2765359 RepID=UPI0018F7B27B|nr:hypothetical protein [Rugamonas sp. CCM 8940]MBJ7312445.1 hypothetical protein [Rugamonas sp. CCM 8940]